MSQEQIEASRYPKHSGDIMLLARIYWLRGKKVDAQELASRTITMRRGTYGEQGGPGVADSLFAVARMLEDGQQYVLAARLLNEVITISGDAPGMRSHLARALWFLANVEIKISAAREKLSTAISSGADQEASEERSLGQDSNDGKVSGLRKRAREVRDGITEREWPDEDTNEGFMRLVSWMLW